MNKDHHFPSCACKKCTGNLTLKIGNNIRYQDEIWTHEFNHAKFLRYEGDNEILLFDKSFIVHKKPADRCVLGNDNDWKDFWEELGDL